MSETAEISNRIFESLVHCSFKEKISNGFDIFRQKCNIIYITMFSVWCIKTLYFITLE